MCRIIYLKASRNCKWSQARIVLKCKTAEELKEIKKELELKELILDFKKKTKGGIE